jgi:hypothetical protein
VPRKGIASTSAVTDCTSARFALLDMRTADSAGAGSVPTSGKGSEVYSGVADDAVACLAASGSVTGGTSTVCAVPELLVGDVAGVAIGVIS